jgi:hypothetical protein
MGRRSKSDAWVERPKTGKKRESAKRFASLGKASRWSDFVVWFLCAAVLVLCAVVFDHIRATAPAGGDGTRHLSQTLPRAGLGTAP